MKSDTQLGEMHDRLIDFHRQHPREGLRDALRIYMRDPLKPRDEHGRLRMNPIFLFLAIVLALISCVFLFFSVVWS